MSTIIKLYAKFWLKLILPITFLLLFLIPAGSHIIEPNLNVKDINYSNKIYPKIAQTIEVPINFVPGSFLNITYFLDGYYNDSFTTTVTSINTTHWTTQSEYTIQYDWESNPFPYQTFSSSISRSSINHTYPATNYYNFFGFLQNSFDFWINTTNFGPGYQFYTETFGQLTIEAGEEISMVGLGNFNAWRISGIEPKLNEPFEFWFEKDSGIFLRLNFNLFASNLQYNLTDYYLPTLPQDYAGPKIVNLIPENGTSKPGGSDLHVEFNSSYGIQNIKYSWDNQLLENQIDQSNVLTTEFPAEDGFHGLFIEAVGNVGFITSHYLEYETNNSLLGVSLSNLLNKSKINQFVSIHLKISSGNGTFIYNWDGTANNTLPQNTPIPLLNPTNEREAILTVYVKGNNTEDWIKEIFVFIIDNSPPIPIFTNLVDGNTYKGSFTFNLRVNENALIFYNIDGETNVSLSLKTNINKSLTIPTLSNGSHSLTFYFFDEANNVAKYIVPFEIYISSFGWVWNLEANKPNSIDFINENGDFFFRFTVTSEVDQNFSIVKDFIDTTIILPENLEYVFKFNIDQPSKILYLEFFLPEPLLDDNIVDIYDWTYWDPDSHNWEIIPSFYNDVDQGWEATFFGSDIITIFGLIHYNDQTTIETLSLTQGSVPSFLIETILVTFLAIILTKKIFNNNKKV